MPGAPPRKSTARPESSARAGRPEMRAALRALRMAFSTNDRPVSSGSTWLNSPIERTRTASPSMACSSLSLPALWLASTSSLKALTGLVIREHFLVEGDAVGVVALAYVEGEAEHFAGLERELRQVIDGLAFADLTERQCGALAQQVLHLATDHCGAGLAGLEHGDVDHALGLAAHQAGGAGDIRLDEAGIEHAVVHVEIAEALLALGDSRQGHAQGDQEGNDAAHDVLLVQTATRWADRPAPLMR